MNKNNFFMMMLLGLAALVGTSFEVRCSEQPSSLAPYVVLGATVGGVVIVTALTNTKTYETFSQDRARHAHEREISENPVRYATPLSTTESGEKTGEARAQAYLQNYEKERIAQAQNFATKITKETLPSHIIDDYSGKSDQK